MSSPTSVQRFQKTKMSESIAQVPPQSSTLKRRHSEYTDAMGEKRQRVDSGPTRRGIPDDNMTATQGVGETMAPSQEEDGTDEQEPPVHHPVFMSDPQLSMRILSLPVLESLSTQILSTLAQGPYSETIKIVTEPETDFGQAYAILKRLFDETKKIYSRQASFLSAKDLNIQGPEHRSTIRTTNMATFVASVFGGQDVGFYELNDHFIETFTPDSKPLLRVPGELFLNLKTQMYLSAVSQEEQERTKEDILEDLFPLDIEEILAERHPESPLFQSELTFIESSKIRREYLMNQPSDVDSTQALSEKFAWEEFLRSLSVYLGQSYDDLLAPYMERHALKLPASPIRSSLENGNHNHGDDPDNTLSMEFDINALAEQAAQEALQAYGQDQQQSQSRRSSHPQQSQNGSQNNSNGSVPFPTQTQPTRVLYEKARQAAVAKSTPTNARRPGLPSQRRAWSTEEENALMAGLDAVRGPHWSQILALYGNKGTVNEMLKDRNQVQLKDKARNLKLFFLKSGIEVPYYLQSVTGELKTRAPSQAARREQEERNRLGSDDERARFDGILALSQGLNQPPTQQSPEDYGPDPGSSPEQFQVVEPEEEEIPTRPRVTDDEQFRQRFMAATEAETAASVRDVVA